MIEVIYNDEWPEDCKIHLRIDGKEQCNTDDIQNKKVESLKDFMLGDPGLLPEDFCDRCFS